MHKHTPHCCISLIPFFRENNTFVGINSHESIRFNPFVPVQPLQTWLFLYHQCRNGSGSRAEPPVWLSVMGLGIIIISSGPSKMRQHKIKERLSIFSPH